MWKFIVPVAAIGLFLGVYALDGSLRDSYSGTWNSSSAAQARDAGILLQNYEVTPRVVTYQNYRVEFTDCWLEERTRTTHDFIFFKRVIKPGGEPRLILNYRGQRLRPDPDAAEAMLVLGRHGWGQDLGESKYGTRPYDLADHQYANLPLRDSLGSDTLYFSIIRTWEDKRNYRIKAYPKR